MAKMNFNDFAAKYCGTNDRAEQIEQLKDALLVRNTIEEVDEADILELFDTECQIEQTYFEPNGYYDVNINNMYTCMSLIKII